MSIAAAEVMGAIAYGGKEAYWRVADIVQPEDFPSGLYADLFRLAGKLESFDFMQLAEEAERRGVCNPSEVIELHRTTGSMANIRGWAERVRDDAIVRRFRQLCREGAETGDIGAMQAAIGGLLAAKPAHAVSIKDALSRMWTEVETRYVSGGEIAGLPTGFPLLDEMTGGLQPGRIYGVGARAKMGKTIFAMNVCANLALAGRHVAVWSLEMSESELAGRMACAVGGVPNVMLQRPKLFDDAPGAMSRLHEAVKSLKSTSLRICDRTDVSVEDIEAHARQYHASGELDLMCVDYLGLLRLAKADRHDLAIAQATRRLKIIAKELKIPVLLVFQLNRGSENGAQVRPPRPSDARDSGAIEQDLDAMFLLHRPSYYDKSAPKGLRFDLAIQRNGPTGLIRMEDELDRCRFTGGAVEWTESRAVSNGRDDDL